MKTYAYDIECLINLFTATFVNVEDEQDKRVFVIGLGRNDQPALLNFLEEEMILVGYNCHSYDDPMIRKLMVTSKNIEKTLYALSEKLVNDKMRDDRELISLRYPRDVHYAWKSIDLMKILAFDKLGISLKQTAINLNWHKIQDMPLSHFAIVMPEQLDMILAYNLNDVLITKKLYEEIAPLRKLREELSSLYGVDLTSASDSKMANLILEQIYTSELGVNIKSIRDMRTVRSTVALKSCVADFVSFKTPLLKELLQRISSTIVYDYKNYQYSDKVHFAGCTFALGIGGLHSEDEPGVFVSDDVFLIQDADVASYYPNLIINNNFYPEHLGEDFIRVLKRITAERIAAKKSGDKVKADGLKITINSIFGKLGSSTFWLLDAKQMLSTTLSGQLGLLMFIEDLHLNGIQVISANTDGVVCRIPRKLMDTYYAVAHEWEKKTNLQLEFTPYSKYVRRDVNSYITKKEDGHTKEKGAFLKEVDLKKAYHMPIVAKALSAYFIDGKPIKQTLEECNDIMQFCISQKTGQNFEMLLVDTSGTTRLQKTNRFYVTKKGGSLKKRHEKNGNVIGLYVGRLVRILNDFDPSIPFDQYQVDLSFYEKEILKIVDEIEPKQLSLFDLGAIEGGSKTKMSFETEEQSQEPPTVKSLNKLGKNQLAGKLKTIVESNDVIEDIHPRYVYVMDFDEKNMKAVFYALKRGTPVDPIEVDKKAYKLNGMNVGDLIYCTKFTKSSGKHMLVEYEITQKILEWNQEELEYLEYGKA